MRPKSLIYIFLIYQVTYLYFNPLRSTYISILLNQCQGHGRRMRPESLIYVSLIYQLFFSQSVPHRLYISTVSSQCAIFTVNNLNRKIEECIFDVLLYVCCELQLVIIWQSPLTARTSVFVFMFFFVFVFMYIQTIHTYLFVCI